MTAEYVLSSRLSLASKASKGRISNLDWTSRTLIKGTTLAFFGPELLHVEPEMASIFLGFDDKMWKLLYGAPRP